jgi:phosphoenolpyruvate carboxykinase (ATP)
MTAPSTLETFPKALGLSRAQFRSNLSTPSLYEEVIRRNEAHITADGSLACLTGIHTGRSPLDKFLVREPVSESQIAWNDVNRAITAEQFERLFADITKALDGSTLYVREGYAGAALRHRLPIRIITEYAWHSLFAKNLFLYAAPVQAAEEASRFTVVDAPSFRADPTRHGTRSEVVIAVSFARRLVLIGGSSYAGEIKKSIFSIMNYLLPQSGVLPMHCSANTDGAGDVALFFGLSGTGKTTLSSDEGRILIGDDEHGWSDEGVFNFEGGCYAKTLNLSGEAEPQIYAATRRFGAVLENVFVDEASGQVDFDDSRYTENGRAAYPISFIERVEATGQAGHPRNVVMLTADAFGVLPPIARLSAEGAMYHFLSGYTAKVAGTEKGVTEPKATFSSCFGAPFLPLPAVRYATMLGERIAQHGSRAWLVNTGWTGGPYGTGARMKIALTRAMLRAAIGGELDHVPYYHHPIFNLDVPRSCPGVSSDVLDARSTWADPVAYDAQAAKLARMFIDNFKTFDGDVGPAVGAAGPSLP